jgi:hypothetical protein
MAHAERPIAFLPNYLARDLKITRASPHPRKDGIARQLPKTDIQSARRCDVGSAITSRINRTVCVMNAPSKIASGIRTPPEPVDASPPPVGSACLLCERRTWNSKRNEQRKITASQAGQMAGYLSSSVGP